MLARLVQFSARAPWELKRVNRPNVRIEDGTTLVIPLGPRTDERYISSDSRDVVRLDKAGTPISLSSPGEGPRYAQFALLSSSQGLSL